MESHEKRVLVALDASAQIPKALETAFELAVREHAELITLFVEDINLFRMAELPFAREIIFPTATQSRIEAGNLERELRVRAAQISQAIGRIAERAQVRWSFQVVRGHIPAELATAAASVNFMLLASRNLRTREAEIRRCLEEGRCSVLLLP